MCEILLTSIIVGAFEFNWGSMRIEYIQPDRPAVVETVYMYTDDYLACLEAPTVEQSGWSISEGVYHCSLSHCHHQFESDMLR